MYLYQNQDRPRIDVRCNFVRLTQLVLCIACTCLSVYNFSYASLVPLVVSSLFTTVGAIFGFLAAVDTFTRAILLLAIRFKLWLVYAYIAAALFVASVIAYVTQLEVLNNFWIPIMLTVYSLTGVVFLWDATCIVFFRKYKVVPLSHANSTTSTPTSRETAYSKRPPKVKRTDGETGSEFKISLNDIGGNPKTSNRSTPRSANGTPVTYGGTFHVSRDIVPMTSIKIGDDKLEEKLRRHECVNTYS